jgi:hypothetical protein
MIKLLLENLNILLRSNYYDGTIVDKFKYFIKIIKLNQIIINLLLTNLNVLLRSNYYVLIKYLNLSTIVSS